MDPGFGPQASVEMTWSKRPTVEKGATPVPPRRCPD